MMLEKKRISNIIKTAGKFHNKQKIKSVFLIPFMLIKKLPKLSENCTINTNLKFFFGEKMYFNLNLTTHFLFM